MRRPLQKQTSQSHLNISWVGRRSTNNVKRAIDRWKSFINDVSLFESRHTKSYTKPSSPVIKWKLLWHSINFGLVNLVKTINMLEAQQRWKRVIEGKNIESNFKCPPATVGDSNYTSSTAICVWIGFWTI